MAQSNTTPCFKSAAMSWYGFGFSVIPIIPGKKQSAVKWDPWFGGYSTRQINAYWEKHPDHEVGLIVGDGIIVFDADSLESIATLAALEKTYDMTPALTVTTSKGVHHYFRRSPDTCAKTDSHSTEEHPGRIDVKTGRALVVLPPSTGKEIEIQECEDVDGLSEANQEFIDAVAIHNGRVAPRPHAATPPSPLPLPANMDRTCTQINAMLQHVDPDCGYQDWLHGLMGIFHATGGSENGFALADAWSSKGRKYRGKAEIRSKWQSFSGHAGTSITIGTLHNMLSRRGLDWTDVCDAIEPQFTRCESGTMVVQGVNEPESKVKPSVHADTSIVFRKFSLTGTSAQLEADALEQVYVLDSIALLGQWTVLYARHNTGKTLIVIFQLVEAIRKGAINASDIFYFNLDDTQHGLTEKTKIAEEMGFHILCDGYHGFKVANFINHIEELCNNDQARGIVLVLDTLKKFTDLMDKRSVSRWNTFIRRFVAKGGTVIGLAHVNKNPGNDGKSVYAGTSDIIDDADCAYVLDVVSVDDKTHIKIVEFENRKRRGNVVNRVSYSFSVEDGLSYHELLASVSRVDESELVTVKLAEEIKSDTEIIEGVIACISDGVNTKMRLRDAVCDRVGCSRRSAVKVIEKYSGTDPAAHRWSFNVGERGAKVYRQLEPDTSSSSAEAS